jgi:hypothetical protein
MWAQERVLWLLQGAELNDLGHARLIVSDVRLMAHVSASELHLHA